MHLNSKPAPPISQVVRNAESGLVFISTPSGTGSGFLIDHAGYIITNDHVVEQHSTVDLEFVNGDTCSGVVLRKHPTVDLACIFMLGSSLTPNAHEPLRLGNSAASLVGEDVIALGYPLRSILKGSPTVTKGIISAKRPAGLQTDAAINPGNSGGPLLDSFGNVIGVNTFTLAPVDGRVVEGIGFAIPIDDVKDSLELLKLSSDTSTKSPTPAPTVPRATRKVRHLGLSGFSIDMPSNWTPNITDYAIRFETEGKDLFVFVTSIQESFDLRNYALRRYEGKRDNLSSWQGSTARWHGQLLGRVDTPYAFSYDDYGGYLGRHSGREEVYFVKSPTGTTHLILAELRLQQDLAATVSDLQRELVSYTDTLSLWPMYGSNSTNWSIAVAPGWQADEVTDRKATFVSPRHDAFVMTSVVDLNDATPVDELCRLAVKSMLDRKEGAWDTYQILSSHEDDSDDHDWYRINYRFREKGKASDEVWFTQVARSGSTEYIIHAFVKEESVETYAAEIDAMLASFRCGRS